MPRCIAENPKLSNIFVSASEKEATSTHSNLYYNLHKSNSFVSQAFFNLRCRATLAFPAARPARRHHVSVHRSALPPCIPESRKGLVNNGAISRTTAVALRPRDDESQGGVCLTLPPKEAAEHSFTHRRTPNFSQGVLCVKFCEVRWFRNFRS